jgi:hypothetical protein
MKLSLGVVVFVTAVFCVACSSAIFAEDDGDRSVVSYEGHQVLRFGVPSTAHAERTKLMAWIDANRLDMWGVHPEWVDVRLDKSFQARVSDLGLPFHVMIEDLQADLLAERASIAVRVLLRLLVRGSELKWCVWPGRARQGGRCVL